MKSKQLFFLTPMLLMTAFVQAQGCSDGGFCSLKYHADGSAAKNSIVIGNVIGAGDGSTFINNTYITYTRALHKNIFWDTKLTANYASGSLASNFNVGDVFTNLSFKAWQSPSQLQALSFLGGLKIPLTKANDKAANKPLPMAYQASLGTFDLLLGGSYKLNKWEFTQAWQIPLTKENKNTFLKEYSVSNSFPSSNKFQRKADALLRVAYNIHKKESKFSFKPNLLAIYHLAEDSYENIYAKRQMLAGSKGLTLNGNIIGRYQFSKNKSIELSVAAPFVVRDIRPDGLTREFTAGIEYKISF
jgi:Putative MetA-pathway of phenol degradation